MTLPSLYAKIDLHLLHKSKPSVELNAVYSDSLFRQYPFDMLYGLKHPEGEAARPFPSFP